MQPLDCSVVLFLKGMNSRSAQPTDFHVLVGVLKQMQIVQKLVGNKSWNRERNRKLIVDS